MSFFMLVIAHTSTDAILIYTGIYISLDLFIYLHEYNTSMKFKSDVQSLPMLNHSYMISLKHRWKVDLGYLRFSPSIN